jgi:predicted thioesterase
VTDEQGAEFSYVVTEADTAQALGSGDVPVLGTPRVLALLEAATVAALRDRLEPARTSVGVQVELRHDAPSRVGDTVQVRARRRPGEGSRVTFDVDLRDQQDRVLASGVVVRVVTARERFG